MAKFIIEGDTKLETLKALIPEVFPVKVESELILCKDCKHCSIDEPGMVYCENITGGWVPDNFYCADGERRSDE